MNQQFSQTIYIARPVKYLDSGNTEEKKIKIESGETYSIDFILNDILVALFCPADIPLLKNRLLQSGWDDSAFESIPEYLEELISMGLAAPLNSVIGEYETQEVNEEYSFPEFYAFPTKDRPQELERALKAWFQLFDEVSQTPGIIIADASVSSRDMNAAVLNSLKDKSKGGIYYFDNNERWNFVRQFSASIRKSAEFALSMTNDSKGTSFGVNRNFILLLTGGKKTAMSDDDILPQFRALKEKRERMNLFTGLDPSEVTPAGDWNELESFGTAAGTADYSRIVEYSGEALKELFLLCRQTDFNLADCRLLENYTNGRASAAVVCHLYWGDSGMGTASYLLANRNRIKCDISSIDRYEKLMKNRLAFRAVENLTAGGKAFMGGHAVFDNTKILPPFSPHGRNEDMLWSFLLEALHPASKIIYSPLSIRHDPVNPKAGSREGAVRWQPGLNETINLVLGYLLREKFPTENTYESVGNMFAEFLDKPEKELDEYLKELVMLAAQGRQRMLVANQEQFGEDPEWWAEDVYTAIEWLNQYVKQERFWIPPNFRDSRDKFIDYCRSFSQLLINWPAIYSEAKEISGRFLSENKI